MRSIAIITLAILSGCGQTAKNQSASRETASNPAMTDDESSEPNASYQFIAPTSDRGAMVFDRNTGCLTEVNLPNPVDMTGQIVDGKKVDAELGRQFFGLIYFNQWTCPKPLTDQVKEPSK